MLNREQLEAFIAEHYKNPVDFSWHNEGVQFSSDGSLQKMNEISRLKQTVERLESEVEGHIRDKIYYSGQKDQCEKMYDKLLTSIYDDDEDDDIGDTNERN